MAQGRGFNDKPESGRRAGDRASEAPGTQAESETLHAGISEMSGVNKEDLESAVVESGKKLRATIDWVQGNYGVLIAAGLGVATVGMVTLWLNRRGGLRSFYEQESANPTLH